MANRSEGGPIIDNTPPHPVHTPVRDYTPVPVSIDPEPYKGHAPDPYPMPGKSR